MSETTALPSAPRPVAAEDAPRPVAKNLMTGALLVVIGLVAMLGAIYLGLEFDLRALSTGTLMCSDVTGYCTEATNYGPWLAVAGIGLVAWGAALLLSSVLELGRRSDSAVGAVERPSSGGPFGADEVVLPEGGPSDPE